MTSSFHLDCNLSDPKKQKEKKKIKRIQAVNLEGGAPFAYLEVDKPV